MGSLAGFDFFRFLGGRFPTAPFEQWDTKPDRNRKIRCLVLGKDRKVDSNHATGRSKQRRARAAFRCRGGRDGDRRGSDDQQGGERAHGNRYRIIHPVRKGAIRVVPRLVQDADRRLCGGACGGVAALLRAPTYPAGAVFGPLAIMRSWRNW